MSLQSRAYTILDLRRDFELRGEDLIRRSTGNVLTPPKGYAPVNGAGYQVLYHIAKLSLHLGRVPETVDHADRNTGNNALSNLREATMSQQQANRRLPRRWPRGVSKVKRRFRAVCCGRYLGYYDTAEEASRAAEAAHKEYYGEFSSP